MSEKIPIVDDGEPGENQQLLDATRQLLLVEDEVETVARQARNLREARNAITDERIKVLNSFMDVVDAAKHNHQERLNAKATVGVVLARMDRADEIANQDLITKEIESDRRILELARLAYVQEQIIANQTGSGSIDETED